MPISVRAFSALAAALVSAAALCAAGMTAQAHGGPARQVADTGTSPSSSPSQGSPTTLTWG